MACGRAAVDVRGWTRRTWLAVAATLAVLATLGSTSARGAATDSCAETTVTAPAVADAWIGANVTSNKGADTSLDVEADPLGAHTRSLVRFALPAVPAGCVVSSAKLRLYTSSGSEGARVEVLRLASGWLESAVVWTSQPAAVGAAAVAWSRDGYMQWNVLEQVRAQLDAGNHGFQVRDAAEGSEEGGAGHGFNSRENAENPPQLVLRFAAPASEDLPSPRVPPAPASVSCGEVITRSTLVTNDLAECPGNGLVVGAPRIVLDLGGHTIDGTGLGSGVLNDGFAEVTVRNGIVQDFDHGVELLSETERNVVEGLTLRENELTAIELFDARAGNVILENTVEDNGGGIALVSGTTGVLVEDNLLSRNSGAALLVRDATANHLEDNEVVGGGDLGVGLERASGNTLLDNEVEGTSDGGIEIRDASHANRIEGNDVSAAGDTGIMVDLSDRNELIENTTHFMSDSGIALVSANGGVVRGNDLRFSTGGLQLDGSSRNRVEGNNASDSTGIGIELGGDSYENLVAENVALDNGATGIYLGDEALIDPGNVVERNIAGRNGGDGIVLAKGGHVVRLNVARGNRGWGVHAAPGTVDGGGNLASANGHPGQCFGIVCAAASALPETAVTGVPGNPTRSTSATFLFAGVADGGVPGFECRLDGAAFGSCTSPWTYTGLGSGTHVFEVRAIVGADRDPTPAAFTWTIDAIAPETSIAAGPAGTVASTDALFSFSSSEAGSTFACALDGGAFAPCVSPRTYGGLTPGGHRFEVRATDAVGNEDPTPASRAWTIAAARTVAPAPIDCGPARILGAQADAWIDQRRPASNMGAGPLLRIRSSPRRNTRALVRFALPPVRPGCRVSSATLRLFAGSATRGRALRVVRLASGWGERRVTWRTQPRTAGAAATTASGRGYRAWNVTAHVIAMYASGTRHGFLIRDAGEGSRAEQRYHSRERRANVPGLVIRYAPSAVAARRGP
jgi:large repetitive protein